MIAMIAMIAMHHHEPFVILLSLLGDQTKNMELILAQVDAPTSEIHSLELILAQVDAPTSEIHSLELILAQVDAPTSEIHSLDFSSFHVG